MMSDTRATILVVDDEENNHKVVTAQLRDEDYAIVTATSGEMALELIDRQLPSLILLDAMMPGISGFDVAEILKSEERTSSIPIIMVTALGDSDSRLAGLRNGVEEFLTKPVARAELVMRIRNLLKLKKHQEDLSAYNNTLKVKIAERANELESANVQLSEAQKRLLQADKMSALGQLAAGVAHEINNPIGYVNSNLGTLKGYVKDMLKVLKAYEAIDLGPQRDPEAIARLQHLKAELELDYLCDDAPLLVNESIAGLSRVRKIVQDLKGFAHVDVDPQWEFSDLREGLDSMLSIANNEIKYKATVVKEYDEIPPVECLPSQLDQVFLNMFVNAAHAIPESTQGVITVRTGCDNTNVWVEISDTGAGISAEDLTRVFDPFFTTKPIGQGTGLGLSLAHGIVQKHNGHIDVRSQPGLGTTFRIVLPIQHPAT